MLGGKPWLLRTSRHDFESGSKRGESIYGRNVAAVVEEWHEVFWPEGWEVTLFAINAVVVRK